MKNLINLHTMSLAIGRHRVAIGEHLPDVEFHPEELEVIELFKERGFLGEAPSKKAKPSPAKKKVVEAPAVKKEEKEEEKEKNSAPETQEKEDPVSEPSKPVRRRRSRSPKTEDNA